MECRAEKVDSHPFAVTTRYARETSTGRNLAGARAEVTALGCEILALIFTIGRDTIFRARAAVPMSHRCDALYQGTTLVGP